MSRWVKSSAEGNQPNLSSRNSSNDEDIYKPNVGCTEIIQLLVLLQVRGIKYLQRTIDAQADYETRFPAT